MSFCSLLVVLVWFGIFTYGIREESTWSRKSDDVANKITKALFDNLHERYGLMSAGAGGTVRDTICKLFLGFDFYQLKTSDSARKLIIDIVDTCLREMNSHPEWAPYFTEYPIGVNTLEIQIWIHKPDQSQFPIGTVRYILMEDGKWQYKIVYPEGASYDITSKTSPKETYEEATDILYAQGRESITK